MFFSRAHNNPTPQTRLALEQTLGTIKKQEEKMSVVGDIVDMKVDGPTRIDFSEQVKTYDVRVLSSPLRNYFRPTKNGKEKKYDNF